MTDSPSEQPQTRGAHKVENPDSARGLAFAILEDYRRTGGFVSQRLDERLHDRPLPDADRRLATELVYGIVRRKATLDAIIRFHVRRPRHRVEDPLWTLLELGAYQLLFLAGIPQHAAVHETVELARRSGQPQWTGFLNGVLRQIGRSVTDAVTDKPAADGVPMSSGRYRKLHAPVFADPREQPVEYLARAFSFPDWLMVRWLSRYDFDEVVRLGFWFNAAHGICLRVNALKTSREAMLSALSAAGLRASAGTHPQAIWLESPARIVDLPGYDEGWFSVQDESAMEAATMLSPRAGERILDLCAAPGGKTAHLAEIMQNEGHITAADIEADRLRMVETGCQRLGIRIVEPRLIRPDAGDLPRERFDAVLVDVPCSNTGVLGKRPEARWRLVSGQITELADLQRRLLSRAADHVAVNGRLVYSTCSIEPEENEFVVEAVLAENSALKLVEEAHAVPGQPADGGYLALLYRTE